MIERYLDFVLRFPKTILILLVVVTLLFIDAMAGLSEDNNPYFLNQSHPARQSIYNMRQNFTGTYDSVLVALYNENGIFNQTSLNAIFELTKKFRLLSFVDETDRRSLENIRDNYSDNEQLRESINRICDGGMTQSDGRLARDLYKSSKDWSLAESDRKYIQMFAERVDPVREMAGLAATENVFLDESGTIIAQKTVNNYDQDVDMVKSAVWRNELMENGSVDREGKVALIVVELSLLDDDAYGQVRAYEAFQKIVANYQEAHPKLKDEFFIAGVPVFFAAQKQVIDHDFGLLLPMVLLLIAVILSIFFRTVMGVLVALINVIICTIWTLGMMAIVKAPLDIITAILPVFLITICSSDAIHVMAEYYHQKKLLVDRNQAIKRAMKLMISPVVLTTLATCLTFLVSTSTAIDSLRNFGIFISFGMFVALIISLLLIPAMLAVFSWKSKKHNVVSSDSEVSEMYIISRFLRTALRPVIRNRRLFVGIFTIVILGAGFLTSLVSVDDMGSGYFAKNSEFRIADDFINQHIAGTSPGWIEVSTGEKHGALSLDMVLFIDKLEKFIHKQEKITYSYSIARYVRRINYTLNDFKPEYDRLPLVQEEYFDIDEETGERYVSTISGNDIVRQSILMYENSGGSDITNVLNDDFSKTVLLYTLGTTVASDYQDFLDTLHPWLAKNTPPGYSVKLAGSPVIWTAVLDELISSQTLSAFLALMTVFVVMSAWLRSLRLGIAGTLPLVTTLVFYFALMGIFSIELNIGTAIISFLVLGIVDYSVHYVLRIQSELKKGLDIDSALIEAMSVSGRAIVANVLVFSIGFMALLFSDFKPLVDLGMLVGFSLLISGVMTLFTVTLFAPWFFSESRYRTSVS